MSEGIVEVTGTAPDGTPSIWTTRGQVQVGGEGMGTLTISADGRVSSGDGIAMQTGSAGSSATVTGAASRWDVTGPLYVGGNASTAGTAGTLSVQSGCNLREAINTGIFEVDLF